MSIKRTRKLDYGARFAAFCPDSAPVIITEAECLAYLSSRMDCSLSWLIITMAGSITSVPSGWVTLCLFIRYLMPRLSNAFSSLPALPRFFRKRTYHALQITL